MLIRNQRKDQLVNLEHIASFMADESGNVTIAVRGNIYIVGTYSTEEKAIKVLDMIQKHYDSLNVYQNNPSDGYVSVYFEMPADEEVEV